MATGVSVKGKQIVLPAANYPANMYMSVTPPNPDGATYLGYVALELQYDSVWHQFDGRSLWYGGVWFQQPYGSFFQVRMTVQWDRDDIPWSSGTL